jgi:hypothetical protein
MSDTLSNRSLRFNDLAIDLETLVRKESSANPEADASAWVEIDGWEDTTHNVKFMWRTVEGENIFALRLSPRNPGKQEEVGMNYDEMQAARHEHHIYPYAAPKLGHEATVLALGIPEAA